MTGGNGTDIFVYSGGNDLITDYKPNEDKIKLNPNAITSSTVKSSDVILTTAESTISIKSAKDKVITFIDDNGNTTEKIFFWDMSYEPLATGLTYNTKRIVLTASNKFNGTTINLSDYLPTVEKVNVSALSKGINVVGNSANNSVKSSAGADTISGGAGKDTILGGNGNDIINGGADNDILKGDAGNDTLLGGDGNDSLYGGLGNNTLTGGKGKDIFAYEGGNDVITDYTAGQDSIKIINGSITKTSYSGNNVIFTVGNGSIIVLNGKGKKISITDSNKKTTTLTYNQDVSYMATKTSSNARWFTADDNNFMTDEFTIDSVADISETNYSIGRMEYVKKNAEFTTCDSLVSASTFDDK